jgi:hypothetical protein
MWQSWINLVLGLWVIASGYLGFSGTDMATNLTVTGVIMAGLALWSGVKERELIEEHDLKHSHI